MKNSADSSIQFFVIDSSSIYYTQALDLRYTVFFAPFGLKPDIVMDTLENSSLHMAAVQDEKLVGYGRLSFVDIFAQISQMVTAPGMEGKGIGSGILLGLLEKAAEKKVKNIFLNARIPAVPFYKRFGFTCVGSEFPSKSTGLAHIRMEKKGS